MVEGAPAAGMPPTHIGIQAGPVVFQDRDVYGRTVNIAARIAERAPAVRFERIGPVGTEGHRSARDLCRASRRTA